MLCECHCRASDWFTQPEGSTHAYRVQCRACGKFLKWGTADQCTADLILNDRSRVDPGDNVQTLEQFFVEPKLHLNAS